jgi:hypothetical protein
MLRRLSLCFGTPRPPCRIAAAPAAAPSLRSVPAARPASAGLPDPMTMPGTEAPSLRISVPAARPASTGLPDPAAMPGTDPAGSSGGEDVRAIGSSQKL